LRGILVADAGGVKREFAPEHQAQFDSPCVGCYVPNENFGEFMITLTDKAAIKMKSIIASQGVSGKHVRVYVESGGCCGGPKYGLGFDDKQEGDALVEHEGVSLVVDQESSPMLEGCVIDYVQTPRGEGFQIKNPNAHEHEHGHLHGGGGCGSGGCGCQH
jgi:iron-sulfur cluster assembly protein